MNIKPTRIEIPKKGKIYVYSDGHLNHDRPWIVDVRGFQTIQEHDAWQTCQLFDLTEDDILINLGDFTLASSVEYTRYIFENIKATHYYAAYGNHESFVRHIYRDELEKQYPSIAKDTYVFPLKTYLNPKGKNQTIFMGESSTFKIEDYHVFCRHMAPLIWDNMKHSKNICLCGHSHGNLAHAHIETTEPKILDVGVDNAKKYNNSCFFTWPEIKSIMDKKQIKSYDHH